MKLEWRGAMREGGREGGREGVIASKKTKQMEAKTKKGIRSWGKC